MPSNRHANGMAVVALAVAWPVPGEGASEAATSQPTTAAAETSPGPVVGPIAYYVAQCARCHGDVSAAYVGVDHPKRGPALEQVIDEMAAGPGQAPLDAEGLKQQTALHEAMFGKTPFVWLDASTKDRIAGEVLSGTTLSFETPAGPGPTPKIEDHRFDLPRRPGTLIARRGEAVVKIPVR